MADRTIINLPEATTLANTDVLLAVTTTLDGAVAVATTNRKITLDNLRNNLGSRLNVYADNTAVTAISSANTGDLAYVQSPASVVVYDGSNWKQVATLGSTLT